MLNKLEFYVQKYLLITYLKHGLLTASSSNKVVTKISFFSSKFISDTLSKNLTDKFNF